jgi:hypothetical protein
MKSERRTRRRKPKGRDDKIFSLSFISLSFILKKKGDDELSLRLPWGFRAVFAFLAALLLGSIIVAEDGQPGFLSPLLILLFLTISLYEESWVFDRRAGLVRHLHGLLPLKKCNITPVEDIEALAVRAFRTGSIAAVEKKRFFQRDLVKLSLVLRDSSCRDIEIIEAKHDHALRQRAESIARFMDISCSLEL